MTNLHSILKSRDITLLTKVCIVKAMFFFSSHVWKWDLVHKEGWAPKNWCFRIVVLENVLESPLDSKEIYQSILKEINPEYSLEGLMLKLKLQYFGHLMQRTDSFWKRPWCWEGLRAREGGDRGWDGWMASLTWWTWVWANSGRQWRIRKSVMLQSMGSQRAGRDWAAEQQQ